MRWKYSSDDFGFGEVCINGVHGAAAHPVREIRAPILRASSKKEAAARLRVGLLRDPGGPITLRTMPDEPATRGAARQTAQLLQRVREGDRIAAEELLPLVYEQLRGVAAGLFQRERAGHTLQPTALVHEVYAKLVHGEDRAEAWRDREHFCAISATAMRQILCDHARAKRTAKRTPTGDRKTLTMVESPAGSGALDVLELDDLLSVLAEADAQGARVVDLRFFGGMSHPEIARVLDVSVQVVDRAWRRARAWLQANLAGDDD